MNKLWLIFATALLGVAGCVAPAAREEASAKSTLGSDGLHTNSGARAGKDTHTTERRNDHRDGGTSGSPTKDSGSQRSEQELTLGELVYKTDWDNASESDIEKILRLLQEKGSTWADDVLASGEYRNLDKETEDDFYRQMFLEVESLEAREEEDANLERIRQEFEAGGSGSSSIPSGYRGDRMPFGKSMFGPWDTGIGPSGP